MFEQSLLLDSRHGAKAGALAVSFTTQAAAAGVLLLIPLLYHQRLPFAQLSLPTFLPIPPPPPIPRERHQEQAPKHPAARRPLSLHDLTRIPPLNTRPQVVDDAPQIAFDGLQDFGAPSLAIASLPQISVTPPPPPTLVPVETHEKPVAVSGTLQAAKLIHKVVPIYPALARQARVSGTVHLLGIVSKGGRIEQLQVLSGHPLLVQAALEAVREWVYSPTILSGKPTEVSAPIDVIFTLAQ